MEHVFNGDESTVQSRFIQRISQHMNAACKAVGVDKVMADYKSSIGQPVSGAPDVVVLTGTGALLVMGEIKARWIFEHDFR